MQYVTIYREVPDIYNPDPDALVEVGITISYSVARRYPDVGIFSDYAEDICVAETDSDIYPVEWAEAWLDKGFDRRQPDGSYRPDDKEASYVLERVQESVFDFCIKWNEL